MPREFITVGPVDGRRVRDPLTRRVITEPTRVRWSIDWQRALDHGDVELVEDTPPTTAARKPRKSGEE